MAQKMIAKVGGRSYVEVEENEVPSVRFSAPQHMQGQTVEWSFGNVEQRSEGAPGDRYARREDKSALTVTYFELREYADRHENSVREAWSRIEAFRASKKALVTP